MDKKRDLYAMLLFGILTLGIYNLVVTLKLMKNFYTLNGTPEIYSKRVGMYCLYYIAGIASYGLYAYSFAQGSNILMFSSMVLVMFIYLSAIIMVMVEYAVITVVSRQYGIVTGEAYRYIVPCLTGFNTIVISLTMQTMLNKIIDLKNSGVTPVKETV